MNDEKKPEKSRSREKDENFQSEKFYNKSADTGKRRKKKKPI